MAHTVIGFFKDAAAAQRAAEELVHAGFNRSNIDIAHPDAAASENKTGERNESESGITRFFKSLFGESSETEKYTQAGNSGKSIVTVQAHTAEEARQAANLLDDYGALDVYENNRSKELHYDFDTSRNEESSPRPSAAARLEQQDSIDYNESEDRDESKRMRSRIIEMPVANNMRLREEGARDEGNPMDSVSRENNFQPFQAGELELTESKEVPIINKEARVVEEINIQKEVEEKNETVRETLRATDIQVTKINPHGREDISNMDDNNRIREGRDRDSDWRNNSDAINREENRDPLFGA